MYKHKHTRIFWSKSEFQKLKQKHVTCFLSGPLDTLKGWGCISIGQKKAHTVLYRPKPYDNIKELVYALTMCISSYGCTGKFGEDSRSKKLELHR